MTFIDDFSWYVWVFYMKEKSKTLTNFKGFTKNAESEVGQMIQYLCSNNGGEYTSDEFNMYLQEHKVRMQFTCPNTPQKNEVSE